MISPLQSRRGFSLIEMLLVLALLVMIAGITAVALDGSMMSARLDEGAQRVRTAWSDARLQTISAGEQMAFTCLLGSRDFRLSSCNDSCAPAGTGEETSEGASGQLPNGIVFRSLRSTPRNSPVQELSTRPPNEGQWSSPVIFTPDGTSYDAVVVIENESGRQIELSLRGLTCTASEKEGTFESERPR
ncbi:MAG: prepilin-type N-terminal cleavage/methylation domain-containing protein [Aeoliella sp.]